MAPYMFDPVDRILGFQRERTETQPERQLITAALGGKCERWLGNPKVSDMEVVVASHPYVLESVGPKLLVEMIGMKGCGPAIRFLLGHNVPFQMPMDEYNEMHEGAWCDAVDSLEALFESGVTDATCVSVKKAHQGWPDNVSLMYWAAFRGSVNMAKLLLKHGVAVHHELPMKSNGERGNTSLQEAMSPNHFPHNPDGKHEVARLLIEDGAFYDIGSACAANDTERLNELLDEDETLAEKPMWFDMRPLHWAARANSDDAIKLLLSYGVDVDCLNSGQRTPVQLAAEQDAEEAINLLAEAGANLNTQDKKGRTPLHRATYEGKVAACNALLAHGADPTLFNKKGKTAFQIARKDAKFFKEMAD